MRNLFFNVIGAVALMGVVQATAIAGDRGPTVIELYTSQGCHSCPPADAYLGELAERDDVIALSFHVDYWDYIGWKDPYALPSNTPRQRQYAKHLGMRYVYTPQMVIQGMAHATGSDRRSIRMLMKDLEGAKRLDIKMTGSETGLEIDVPGGTFDEDARLIAVAYDTYHETEIRRGENAGKKLGYHNVVRDWKEISSWDGKPLSVQVSGQDIELTNRDGAVVLLQSVKSGRILGAAQIAFTPSS